MSALTGTVRDAAGNPLLVDGKIWFEISQNANVIAGGGCGGPYAISPGIPNVFTLLNGDIQGSPTIPGQSCISPSNTYYKMSVVTDDGVLVLRRNVVVDGAAVDIGTLAAPVLPGQTGVPGPQGPPMELLQDNSPLPNHNKLNFQKPLYGIDDPIGGKTDASLSFFNLTGSPALVADKIDFGTRSMSAPPTAGQLDNRVAFKLAATGSLGLDTDNRGSLATVSLTGATGWTYGLKITHTNTQAGTDSAGIHIDTNVSSGAGGAGLQIVNDGFSDGLYIGARGPAGPVANGTIVGLGIDVNRSAVAPYTAERNSLHQGAGLAIDNFSSTNPATTGSTCLSLRNQSTTYNFPCLSIQSGLTGLQIAPWSDPTVDTAGNVAFRIINQTGYGTPRMVLTHGGWIGIGINPPGFPLHISSGLDTQIALRHNAAGGKAQIVFENNSGSARVGVAYDNANDKIYIGNASVAVLTCDQNNDVTLARDLSVGRDVAVTGKLTVTGQSTFTGQPRANVYRSSAQSVNNVTETPVDFDSETTDVGGLHEGVTNPSRITIPTGCGGTYILSCNIQFANGAGGIRQIRFRKNGATILSAVNGPPTAAGAPSNLGMTIHAELVATDYVQVLAYHDSGAALNVDLGAGVTWFAATKVA